MNISVKKYNEHCNFFNSLSIESLKSLYELYPWECSNEMSSCLTLYLPTRLFKEIETLNKVK